jgi:hypothetical protein
MAKGKKVVGSRFFVDFGNIKLSKDVEKRIEMEIRSAVLRQIATIDSLGDFSSALPGRFKKPWPWWPGTMGIIIWDPNKELPFGATGITGR